MMTVTILKGKTDSAPCMDPPAFVGECDVGFLHDRPHWKLLAINEPGTNVFANFWAQFKGFLNVPRSGITKKGDNHYAACYLERNVPESL